MVTEIRRGLRDDIDGRRILHLMTGCHVLSQPDSLWEEAGALGALARQRGMTIKTLDLLIATYALAHSVDILTTDADFMHLQNAGIGLHVTLAAAN